MLSPGTWSGRERSSHTGQQQCRGQGLAIFIFSPPPLWRTRSGVVQGESRLFVTPPPPSSRMFLHVPSPFERARTHFSIAGIAFPHEFGNPPRPRRGRRGRMRPHSCARPLRATRIPLQGHVRAASRGALRPRASSRACLAWEVNEATGAERPVASRSTSTTSPPSSRARPLP